MTHLHFDHSGGALKYDVSGNLIPVFLNAKYHISRRNWEAANMPNPRDRASYLKENYRVLENLGQLSLIEDDSEIMPGFSAYTVDGHTTGQQLVKVENSDEVIVFCSDLIPLRSHLRLPWIMGYDLNALLTLQEKTKFLNIASENGWWLFFYHDPKTIAVKIEKGKKYYKVIEEVLRDIR